MAWQIFATKTSPTAMSALDTQSSNLAQWSLVGCTASGTNVITLTPILSGYTAPAYANFVGYRFAAANSNSGATTLKIGALATLNCYRADGTTQITTGDIVSGQVYEATYNSALNSAAGGFYITNVGQGSSSLPDPVTVAHGGTGLMTLTDKNVILGAGTSTPTFVAPSTSGNVLTSNGTTWTSATPSASALSSKVISFTRATDAGSGNVATTGVGFIPTSILFTWSSSDGSTYEASGTGWVDSAKTCGSMARGNTTAPGVKALQNTDAITLYDSSVSNSLLQIAIVASFDADGFTLTWAKVGATSPVTITITAICYK